MGTLIKIGVISQLVLSILLIGVSFILYTSGINDAVKVDEGSFAVAGWGILLVFSSLGSMALYWATVILVFIWLYTSYKNTIAFDQYAVETTPGWTIAHWFIPIGNLFLPYRTIKEIYLGSGPESSAGLFTGTDIVPRRYLAWWWLWLISGFATRVTETVAKSAAAEDQELTIYLLAVSGGLWVGCGVLFFTIIDELSRRQERLVLNWTESGPPAPSEYSGNQQILGSQSLNPPEQGVGDIIETDEDYRGSGQ